MSFPSMKIIEQPMRKIRFRYKSENRSTVNLLGEHSTKQNPTFPELHIEGIDDVEDVFVEASCVTAKHPYKAHPFMLYGHGTCDEGICRVNVNKVTKTATFSNLSVQCVKIAEMHQTLKLRQDQKVDPYNQGFQHAATPATIDKTAIRLCFRLFRKNTDKPLAGPIVSNPIYHQANGPLTIVKMIHDSAPMTGGTEVILLCEKLGNNANDIKIKFFQGNCRDPHYWQDYAEITATHKDVAILFKTPPYPGRLKDNGESVLVGVQIYDSSNGNTSNTWPFRFTRIRPEPPNLYVSRSIADTISSPVISSTGSALSNGHPFSACPCHVLNFYHRTVPYKQDFMNFETGKLTISTDRKILPPPRYHPYQVKSEIAELTDDTSGSSCN